MARVFWADVALARFEALPLDDQVAIQERLQHVEPFPEMYPLVLGRSRWRGHRKILIDQRWVVLYRTGRQTRGHIRQVFVKDNLPARSNY